MLRMVVTQKEPQRRIREQSAGCQHNFLFVEGSCIEGHTTERSSSALIRNSGRKKDIHAGVCGPHMNGHMLAKKRLRQGTTTEPGHRLCETSNVREVKTTRAHLSHYVLRLQERCTPFPGTKKIFILGGSALIGVPPNRQNLLYFSQGFNESDL